MLENLKKQMQVINKNATQHVKDYKVVSLRIRHDVHARAKAAAAKQGITLWKYMENALLAELKKTAD